MADDLVARIHGEIRERLELSRTAKLESERLEAALAALDLNKAVPTRGSGRVRASRSPSGQRQARAPRGANRAAVLTAVEQHPDATPAEIRKATAVAGNTLHSVLRILVERGELQRTELASGRFGYRLALASNDSPVDAADATTEQASLARPEPAQWLDRDE